jgi:hypothetical protein
MERQSSDLQQQKRAALSVGEAAVVSGTEPKGDSTVRPYKKGLPGSTAGSKRVHPSLGLRNLKRTWHGTGD